MLALIGGSGLNTITSAAEQEFVSTEYGFPSAAIELGEIQGQKFAFLARHGKPHQLAPHRINYRANIAALKSLGVNSIIAVNAVGGINQDMPTGSLIIPDQIIDYTYGRESSFFDGDLKPLDHIDFSKPYNQALSDQLLEVAAEIAIPVIAGACYAVTQGPRLETDAEIRRLAQDGCDIVGMTAMPEAALAKELGMHYASICIVVNHAAGLSDEEITLEAIHQVLDTGLVSVKKVIEQLLAKFDFVTA